MSKKSPRSSKSASVLSDVPQGRSKPGNRLLFRVLETNTRFHLFRDKESILLALSGGPDSTALLYLFVLLRKKMNLRLSAIHVNYRLRGKDSDYDERFVKKLCEEQDIPLFIERPRGCAGKNEEFLRDIRYTIFETIRRETGCQSIAVAHTEDDQAETVLMRLIRGAGMDGLGAIRPKNEHLIRPLIDISKRDIIRFLKEGGHDFRKDATNNDTTIFRNKIRHHLIPLLEKDYQPGIKSILARTARIFAEQGAEDGSRASELSTVTIPNGVSFSRKELLKLSDAEQSREIRTLFRAVMKQQKNPSEAFVHECKKMLKSEKNKIQRLRSKQLNIEAKGDTVVMIKL